MVEGKADIKPDIKAAEDRGEGTGLMEPLVLSEGICPEAAIWNSAAKPCAPSPRIPYRPPQPCTASPIFPPKEREYQKGRSAPYVT